MRVYDIILKKRNGEVLSTEEIEFFVKGFTAGEIPDYQAAAFLMAVYFQGMTPGETTQFTKAVMHSGDVIDLSAIPGLKVDKHSTGGVGDKTTIVLAPLVAAAGGKVAKISGRGLGHTGGTVDKFAAFKGMSMGLDGVDFIQNVKDIGLAINGQTANLVPADKKLYALRDVTGTVENISLIACSIMSKKLASGSDSIVLDVKTGSGAFMKKKEEAFELARAMMDIGNGLGRKTVAIISNMEQPLGRAVGNILEVEEAIATLKGNGPEDLRTLCLELGAHMLVLSEIAPDLASAKEKLIAQIENGSALEKLKALVKAQGGDPAFVEDGSLFDKAPFLKDLLCTESGYVSRLDALTVGNASMLLGAGRATKESNIDLTAGIYLHKKIGEHVEKGEALATLYTSDEMLFNKAMETLKGAYGFSEKLVEAEVLIYGAA